MRKTTIHEIAAKAGVSSATVSRAIHSPHLLNEKTLQRIRQLMEDQDYSYNAAAANLSKGTSSGVAVVVPRVNSPVFADTITGIQEYLQSCGYYVTVASTHYDAAEERHILKRIMEQRPAGLLLTGYAAENESFVISLAAKLPLIVMWEKAIPPLNYVGFNNYQSTLDIFTHLFSLGHRRIAAILGPYTKVVRAKRRYQAYLDFLSGHGLPFRQEYVCEAEPTLAEGKRAMEMLVTLPERPTAVFCNNDLQAIAAIRVINDAGLSVPGDISIFGFDDAAVSQYITPPLTTLHVPSREIGTESARFLHELMRGAQSGPVAHIVDTPFILRNSCRALREA